MSFNELMQEARQDELGHGPRRRSTTGRQLPWIEQLRRMRLQALAQSADPWMLRLERVRGTIGYDGVERVSTQALFDTIEVPQRARRAGACRRLAKLMRDLGWSSVKMRALDQRGFRDQVRGYARCS